MLFGIIIKKKKNTNQLLSYLKRKNLTEEKKIASI